MIISSSPSHVYYIFFLVTVILLLRRVSLFLFKLYTIYCELYMSQETVLIAGVMCSANFWLDN